MEGKWVTEVGNGYGQTIEVVRKLCERQSKYQKIEEIVGHYGFESSWLCLKKIREVMEE